MIGGIALIGVVTATLASWIVERVSTETKAITATAAQVEQLRSEVAELKQLILEMRTVGSSEVDRSVRG